MVDNLNLKQYRQKSFLYNFFIIWNILIIILLVLLHFYLNNIKIKKSQAITNIKKEEAQLKLVWTSKNQFQPMENDIFYFDKIKASNKKTYDLIGISHHGNIYIFDGNSGSLLVQMNIDSNSSRCYINNNNIFAGNNKGEFFVFSPYGKLLKKTNLHKGKILDINKDIVLTEKSINLINNNSFEVYNSFTNFKNSPLGKIHLEKLDNDTEDILIAETNHLHCFNGMFLKELWDKVISSNYSGLLNTIFDKNNDKFIIVPLSNGTIKILTKSGADVFQINLNTYLNTMPLVVYNKDSMFLQTTESNSIYAFDFYKRKSIWTFHCDEKIIDIKNIDINLNDNNEIFVLTESGHLYILNSNNGSIINSAALFSNKNEKVSSQMLLNDIYFDNNVEITFATDQGNVYLFKYIILNNNLNFKNILKYLHKN